MRSVPRSCQSSDRLAPGEDGHLPCVQSASREGLTPQSTTVPSPFSVEAGQEWIARQHGRTRDGQGWSLAMVDAESGRAVGCVVLLVRPQPGVVGLGYWLTPVARNRGYATRAVGLMTSWALQVQGFARVEAWVEPDNAASSAVLRRCGFAYEGRLRSFLSIGPRRADAAVYSRLADDRAASAAGQVDTEDDRRS